LVRVRIHLSLGVSLIEILCIRGEERARDKRGPERVLLEQFFVRGEDLFQSETCSVYNPLLSNFFISYFSYIHYNFEYICEEYVELLSSKKVSQAKEKTKRENEDIYVEDDAQECLSINVIEIDIVETVGETEAINNVVTIEKEVDKNEFPIVSDNEFALLEESIQTGINERITQWTSRNLDTLRLNIVTELLLREEGHTASNGSGIVICLRQVRSIIMFCK